jgi:t-SNARE complex subunit (syntaxin)
MVRYMPNARFATKCSVLKAGMELHAYTDTVVLKIGRMMKNNSQFLMSSLVLSEPKKQGFIKDWSWCSSTSKEEKAGCKSRRGKRKKKLLVLVCYVICNLSIFFILSFLVLLCPL